MSLTSDYQTPSRMALKEKAIPLPNLDGKTVLDVGCEHGHWCWLAASRGALVTGLDRNRVMKGQPVDLIERNTIYAEERGLPCTFKHIDLGKQWHSFGRHDVTLCFSMYHYVYENCGDHLPVWYWLWRHTSEVLLWENPVSDSDWVVKNKITKPYREPEILAAAEKYFEVEHIGPALHVPTREVWRCWPKSRPKKTYRGKMQDGAKGATKAFEYFEGRRRKRMGSMLGADLFPGSLNLTVDRDFHWDEDYYRFDVYDPVSRSNLESEWQLRPMRFYPVDAEGPAWALRFENEKYKENFVELIADRRLRDSLPEVFSFDC